MDEVEDVQFVSNKAYTPFVTDRDRKIELIDRGNPATHYLMFRDFADYRSLRKRENLKELTDEEWAFCQRKMWNPQFLTNHWREDDRFQRSNILRRGYMAVQADRIYDVAIY